MSEERLRELNRVDVTIADKSSRGGAFDRAMVAQHRVLIKQNELILRAMKK
jgi:hypothetical protein